MNFSLMGIIIVLMHLGFQSCKLQILRIDDDSVNLQRLSTKALLNFT